MPRPCAVETYAGSYKRLSIKSFVDATDFRPLTFSAADLLTRITKDLSVKLHGTSPWHLLGGLRLSCSGEREPPRRKAVASVWVTSPIKDGIECYHRLTSSDFV
jgi:hypothetical protein